MKEEKVKGSISSALGIPSLIPMIGLSAMMGGLLKMFGTTEQIPKGVVRELMEGVMDGLLIHFGVQIDELRREKENLSEKLEEKERRIEELEQRVVAAEMPQRKKRRGEKES